MDYAKVAVNLPLKNLFRQFTYKVPPSLDFIGPDSSFQVLRLLLWLLQLFLHHGQIR